MINGEDGVGQKIRNTGHEQVVDASEVRAIAHFLSDDVCRIYFARNMLNLESLVLHPFTNGVLTKFDVMGSLQGHVVGLLHTRVIVVERTVGETQSGITYPASETLLERFWKSMTFLEVAHVTRISASQELREVHSC